MLKELIGDFSKLEPKTILVAGDLMLDTYTIGKAKRISPEAPVAVIHVEKEEMLPGGAGNALLNLAALGATPLILGRVGQDSAGDSLLEILEKQGIPTDSILRAKGYKTPVKNRIVAENQQVVRVDHETNAPLSQEEEQELINTLPQWISQASLIAVSDYAKGFLTPALLKALIKEAKVQKKLLVVDPKGSDFSKYSGAFLVKPNLSEAYAAANAPFTTPIEEVASIILSAHDFEYLMITRANEGISLFSKNGPREDFPVKAKQVKDVTGAGDTVLATLVFCLANGLSLPSSIHFSNVAAAIAIEQFGCAQVTPKDLAVRLFELDSRNKVFDKDHLHALKSALGDTPCEYVHFEKNVLPDAKTIHDLTTLKQKRHCALIASIGEKNPDPVWISALSALHPIDYILIEN